MVGRRQMIKLMDLSMYVGNLIILVQPVQLNSLHFISNFQILKIASICTQSPSSRANSCWKYTQLFLPVSPLLRVTLLSLFSLSNG